MSERTTHKFPKGYTMYLEGEVGDAVGYLRLPAHGGKAARSFRLSELIRTYSGPDIMIDSTPTMR
jgi:hypothetical protein